MMQAFCLLILLIHLGTANAQRTKCDKCSQTLLEEEESKINELDKKTDDLKNLKVSKPWNALYKISNTTMNMKDDLQYMLNAIDELLKTPDKYFFDIDDKELRISNGTENVRKVYNDTLKLNQQSQSILDDLLNIRKGLEATIQELEDFGQSNKSLNSTQALEEGEKLAKEIKDIDLTNHTQKANDVLNQANLQLASIKDKADNYTVLENKLSEIMKDLDDWKNKTNDILKFTESTTDIINETSIANSLNKDRLTNLENKIQIEMNNTIEDNIKNNKDLNNKSSVLLKECEENVFNLKNLSSVLLDYLNKTKEKNDVLSRSNLEYEDMYLKPVKEHVENLTKILNDYQRLFEMNEKVDTPMKVLLAYENIIQNINSAENASIEAVKNVELANKTLLGDPIEGNSSTSLLLRCEQSKNKSNQLLQDAIKQDKDVKELEDDLKTLNEKIDQVVDDVKNIELIDENLEVNISRLNDRIEKQNITGINDNLTTVSERVNNLNNSMYNTSNDVLELNKKLNDLRNQSLVATINETMTIAGKNVSLLEENNNKTDKLMTNVENLNKTIDEKMKTLSCELQLLKDAIQKAKQVAEKITESLTSPGGECYRLYKLENLFPTMITNISVTLSITSENFKNFVIFNLESSNTNDFIELDIVNNRARFAWNLGNNTKRITNPEIIRNTKKSNISYTINVERIWNDVKLEVQNQQTNETSVISNSSNPSSIVLDVKSGDFVRIGSNNKDLQSAGLSIHHLYYDGNKIGLWNFYNQSVTNSCSYALDNIGPDSKNRMYYWDGTAYCTIKPSDLQSSNKRQFSILLTIRTFAENALLFLAVDETNNSSVSVQLIEGNVLFKIGYANNFSTHIYSTEKCNTGELFRVQASREFTDVDKGILKINQVEQLDPLKSTLASINNSDSLPDLRRNDYQLGGINPNWTLPSFVKPLPPPFLGHLEEIKINYDQLNLKEMETCYGIDNFYLNKPMTSVRFDGDGYLEQPSHILGRDGNFGLMFRTLEPRALLLLSAPGTSEMNENNSSYSLSLLDGKIHLWMSMGESYFKMVSDESDLNDGQFHSVRVDKIGKRIKLKIDEGTFKKGTLQNVTTKYNETGRLFIGGINPVETNIMNRYAATTNTISGAIKELIFDKKIAPISKVVQMHHAFVGKLDNSTDSSYDKTFQKEECQIKSTGS